MRASLAAAVGDPGLRLRFWSPERRAYVDEDGHPAQEEALRGTRTAVLRRGRPVALLLSEDAGVTATDLERDIGAALRLALDNERLRAEALAHEEDLRASRLRIVEAADTARRRLERDLHDGAQQALLALVFDVRARLADEGEGGAGRAALQEAAEEIAEALDELRRLAHGIHPSELTDLGLSAALESVSDAAPVPVELSLDLPEHLPPLSAGVVHLVVARAVAGAADTDGVTVDAAPADGRLVVRIRPVRRPLPTVTVDRVHAAGGAVRTDGDVLTLELPCA